MDISSKIFKAGISLFIIGFAFLILMLMFIH